MGLSTNKDVNTLIRDAEKQGWLVTITKNCHLKWSNPNGGLFYSSSSPSDWRVVMAIKKDLRMNGFIELKHKQTRKKR